MPSFVVSANVEHPPTRYGLPAILDPTLFYFREIDDDDGTPLVSSGEHEISVEFTVHEITSDSMTIVLENFDSLYPEFEYYCAVYLKTLTELPPEPEPPKHIRSGHIFRE